jgi:hypothetical protein
VIELAVLNSGEALKIAVSHVLSVMKVDKKVIGPMIKKAEDRGEDYLVTMYADKEIPIGKERYSINLSVKKSTGEIYGVSSGTREINLQE